MKIAIVAPSPTPFTIGGAEKLWLGMLEYINKNTTHQCELIKIPVKENSFWELIESYYKFYKLDLSHFDMIISGKYPAWMVQHHNHKLYMLHCLRGFYDTYHLLNLDENTKTDNQEINELLRKLDSNETTLEEMFEFLFKIKENPSLSSFFQFPSPLLRKIIHFFDKKAMQNIKSFYAISKTVANRKEYFPSNITPKVIYPPSNLEKFYNKSYKYFFTASRLDSAKRMDMIIQAYKQTNTSIPLKIAGTGPLEQELKELAKSDKRIEFLGFVSDKELMEYYANAYGVVFVPYNEDYGLITIEAMKSQKPVITFEDSGGVAEFVENNKTGLISKPDIKELAKNIDYLANNKELAIQMGKEAKEKVKNITWENTINELLKENNSLNKITVVTTYPVYPPRGGGQNRIFYLYKEIAKSIKVEIISLVHESKKYSKKEIAPNLVEIQVPKTKQHAQKEWEIEKEIGVPATDIAMLYLYEETSEYIKEIQKSCLNSDVIIASHPYTYSLLEKYIEIPIVHESHNVEYLLKKSMFRKNKHSEEFLKKLFEIEQKASKEAFFTTVCSNEDAKKMEELYKIDSSKFVIVPNGVDLESVPFVSKEKRLELKNRLGIKNKIVLFIGSWHQPNIEAVEEIFKIAKKLPEYSFVILGSVGEYFKNKIYPSNIGFTGIVNDKEKEIYLSIADIAINPMLTGSGTNLKMLDYMANGIAVVSTKIGARGLNIPKGYIYECEISDFPKAIKNIESLVDIQKSREYVENYFSWGVIKDNFLKALKLIISKE